MASLVFSKREIGTPSRNWCIFFVVPEGSFALLALSLVIFDIKEDFQQIPSKKLVLKKLQCTKQYWKSIFKILNPESSFCNNLTQRLSNSHILLIQFSCKFQYTTELQKTKLSINLPIHCSITLFTELSWLWIHLLNIITSGANTPALERAECTSVSQREERDLTVCDKEWKASQNKVLN